MRNAIPNSVGILCSVAGVGLIVWDSFFRRRPVEPLPKSEYIPAFEAFKYILNESKWGKGPPPQSGEAVSWELQRILETGVIKATGVRHGFLKRQEIPPAHWIVATLNYINAITLGNPEPNKRMRTIALGTDEKITAPYSDVELCRKDVMRQWPKRRWWHRLFSSG